MDDSHAPIDYNDFHRKIGYKIAKKAFGRLTGPDQAAIAGVITRELREHVTSATGDIKDFHEKFGLNYDGPPRQLPPELSDFRTRFMQEELDEYKAGVYANDLGQQFDALIDLIYVALGTAYLQGFPFREGWQEVQRVNMTKVRAERPEDSKRGSGFDVVKPPNWVPPDIDGILERHVARAEAIAKGWEPDTDG